MSDDAWASKAEYDEHKRNDESAGDMADDEASPRADKEWEEDAMHGTQAPDNIYVQSRPGCLP